MTILTSQITVVEHPEDYSFNKVSVIDNGKIKYSDIQKDLSNHFDVIPATFAPLGKESGEIGSYHITKATGMDRVLEYFHASAKDTIAIGDGHNDLSMFQKANYSVAMGNACDEVKEKADAITSSLENDGIYNAFKQLKLIES